MLALQREAQDEAQDDTSNAEIVDMDALVLRRLFA